MYIYRAKLASTPEKSIYDGDTVKLTVDLGFGIEFNLGSCRLYGIDAPEMKGEERNLGIISRDYLRSILNENEWFTIKSFKDSNDKYGRYLVEIFLEDGTNVNSKLIELGLAAKY